MVPPAILAAKERRVRTGPAPPMEQANLQAAVALAAPWMWEVVVSAPPFLAKVPVPMEPMPTVLVSEGAVQMVRTAPVRDHRSLSRVGVDRTVLVALSAVGTRTWTLHLRP